MVRDHLMRPLVASLAIPLALAACARSLPPPDTRVVPPPPAVRVPPGCLANLGGAWVHADDPSWRYLGRDDGGTLVLEAHRVFAARALPAPDALPPPDAGAPAAGPDAGATPDLADAVPPGASSPAGGDDAAPAGPRPPAALITLERTPAGFGGQAVADVLHPAGRICAATYPVEVAACGDGGLVLRAAAAVSLGDGCQTPLPPRTPAMLEHRLTRADAGADLAGPTP